MNTLEEYEGAYKTKEYPNVFLKCGYTQEEIDSKLQDAWDNIFYGNDSHRIYYESGEDEAYILDAGHNGCCYRAFVRRISSPFNVR